jgi:hypothetical protein
MPVKYEVEVDIDFKLLRKQKRVLISLASDKRTSKSRVDALEGIINLLDHMQDAAVESGAASEHTVFGSEDI